MYHFTILTDVPMRHLDDSPWTLHTGTVLTGHHYEHQVDGTLFLDTEMGGITLDPDDVRIEPLSEESSEPKGTISGMELRGAN
jgi:hypothetical protein